MSKPGDEIVIYESSDSVARVEARLEEAAVAESAAVHIEGELGRASTRAKLAQVAKRSTKT